MITPLLVALILELPQPSDYLWRFPDAATVKRVVEFSEKYQATLAERRSWYGASCWHSPRIWNWDGWFWYSTAIRETIELREPWEQLARVHECAGLAQVEALHQLRSMIGESAFRCGRMPPFVPVGRFVERPRY